MTIMTTTLTSDGRTTPTGVATTLTVSPWRYIGVSPIGDVHGPIVVEIAEVGDASVRLTRRVRRTASGRRVVTGYSHDGTHYRTLGEALSAIAATGETCDCCGRLSLATEARATGNVLAPVSHVCGDCAAEGR